MSTVRKLQYHAMRKLVDVGCAIGLRSLLARNRSGRRLLVYHGIDEVGSTRFNTRFTSAADFDRQLAYFKANFNVVSVAEYFAGASHPSRLTVAITFDDGYRNNLTHALPLLEKHQLPAAFYITGIANTNEPMLWADLLDLTAALDGAPIEIQGETFELDSKRAYRSKADGSALKHRCKKGGEPIRAAIVQALEGRLSAQQLAEHRLYWQQLSAAEIAELAAHPLATIGSHGYYHNNLGDIALSNAVDELRASKNFLERTTGLPISSVAWPDGSYTRALAAEALKLGFTQQLLLDSLYPADTADLHCEHRLGINPFANWNNQLIAILRGTYY